MTFTEQTFRVVEGTVSHHFDHWRIGWLCPFCEGPGAHCLKDEGDGVTEWFSVECAIVHQNFLVHWRGQ